MKFNDDEINLVIESAIKFFNDVYGLDFSLSTPNEQNERFFENAKMAAFIFRDEIEYTINNWIRSGSTCSSCYHIIGSYSLLRKSNTVYMAAMVELDGISASADNIRILQHHCV